MAAASPQPADADQHRLIDRMRLLHHQTRKAYGARVVPSMSRKGNCYDNAPVETFFSSLKNELVRHRQFHNQAEAPVAITEYIERFYNRERLHQALGYRSPQEFEQQESGA